MGTSTRFPMESLWTLACESASVAEGAVLVQGSVKDTAKLPSAANSREPMLGLCYEAFNSAAGSPVTIVAPGAVWPAIAAGAITLGDRVVIGGATGTVVAESGTTPVDATRVGIALENVSSGERVAVLIGSVPSFSGTVTKFTASGAIAANRIVIAGNGTATYPGGASPTGALLGVALNSVANGETVYVVTSGKAYVTDSGSGVTANDFITAGGATGLGLTAAPAGGTNCGVVGIALATTTASGSIPVMVSPSRIQG